MYPDELADYLEDLAQEGSAIDPAAQDAEEMDFEDWQEHWVVVDGELVLR